MRGARTRMRPRGATLLQVTGRVTSHLDCADRDRTPRSRGSVPCARPLRQLPAPTLTDVDREQAGQSDDSCRLARQSRVGCTSLARTVTRRRNRVLERAAIGRRAHGRPLEVVRDVPTVKELCVDPCHA